MNFIHSAYSVATFVAFLLDFISPRVHTRGYMLSLLRS